MQPRCIYFMARVPCILITHFGTQPALRLLRPTDIRIPLNGERRFDLWAVPSWLLDQPISVWPQRGTNRKISKVGILHGIK